MVLLLRSRLNQREQRLRSRPSPQVGSLGLGLVLRPSRQALDLFIYLSHRRRLGIWHLV